jgi:hypothetical protein
VIGLYSIQYESIAFMLYNELYTVKKVPTALKSQWNWRFSQASEATLPSMNSAIPGTFLDPMYACVESDL